MFWEFKKIETIVKRVYNISEKTEGMFSLVSASPLPVPVFFDFCVQRYGQYAYRERMLQGYAIQDYLHLNPDYQDEIVVITLDKSVQNRLGSKLLTYDIIETYEPSQKVSAAIAKDFHI